MTTRRFLIFTPLTVIAFLLQSYFWVPTYDQQARGNPQRLTEFIDSSIGDATILNPILSADASSSQIEGKVFEGLIDRDQNLHFRGRLATSWNIYENALFYVNASAPIPGRGYLTPPALVDFLRTALKHRRPSDPKLTKTLDNIRRITLLPARSYSVARSVKIAKGDQPPRSIKIRVQAPARIKLVLKKVDQNLFENLSRILGRDYFTTFHGRPYLTVPAPLAEGKLAALAAALLPATEHHPVIVFHLRPNVTFHDGHRFDAGDVKFTYEAIMNPKNLSPRMADYEPVQAVEIINPLTVRIVYKRLYSPGLSTWSMGILPEHLLNAAALRREALRRGRDPATFTLRDSAFNRHPIGTGPFVFREWKSDQFITLERFDHYWEGPPNYKIYDFRVISDRLTQEMEFYAGTVDSYAVQPFQVQRLGADPRFQSFSGLSFGYTYIGYNERRKPFDDRRVRRALGMAIDVNKIIKYVLYNQGARITGPFAEQTDYYDHAIRPLPYDPRGALKLLAAAGWKRNHRGWLVKDGRRLQFTLITNSGNDIRKAILTIAQDSWKQIGIDVRTDLLEWSVFIQQRVNKADFDALVLGWSMGIEPDLYQIWHSSQTGPNQLNFVGFKNRAADDLIIKIRQEYNYKRLVDDCHRLHAIIAAEQPYTFLFVGKWTAILDKRIVIKDVDQAGHITYKKIKSTKTGDYTFYFNKWIKLAKMPKLTP